MHPEIWSDKPDSCSKCGMALSPSQSTNEPDPEEIDLLRRFRISALFSAPLLILAMAAHLIPGNPIEMIVPWRIRVILEMILASPVCLWGAALFYRRAIQSLIRHSLNMYTLIGLGVSIGYLYSVSATLFPDIFPASFRGHNGEIPVYFEASALIVTLILLGQFLEAKARAKANNAIRKLLDLSPPEATRIDNDGVERVIPLDQVAVGDLLRIRPGEKVPVDGIIVEGNGAIDESMMSGEAIAVEKMEGDRIIGATINKSGALIMRAERVGDQTLLAKIVSSVESAQISKAPMQRMADRIAGIFAPTVVGIAIVTFICWSLLGGEQRFSFAILNAISVLIIACPCVLGLATPMSVMVAMGRGARNGILFKNAESLQLCSTVDTVVFDKTGTLTKGKPSLKEVIPTGALGEQEILRYAAALEQGSEHPLADAILSGAKERGVWGSQQRGADNSSGDIPPAQAILSASGFAAIPGKGVTGVVDGRMVALGNSTLMELLRVDSEAARDDIDRLRSQGQTVCMVAVGTNARPPDARQQKQAGRLTLIGLLGIADQIRDEAPQTVAELQRAGLQVAILTGDHQATAKAVASELHIDTVIAGVLPDQKATEIKKLMLQGRRPAMIGDGINDAPALATAIVGIAMGKGTDIAIESAGITFARDDLRGAPLAYRLSRATIGNMRQNLFFAFFYNMMGLLVASGIFYPAFGLLLNPTIAAAAMSLSSISVISNALRLRRRSLDR